MSKASPTLHATTVPILHSGVDCLCRVALSGWVRAVVGHNISVELVVLTSQRLLGGGQCFFSTVLGKSPRG